MNSIEKHSKPKSAIASLVNKSLDLSDKLTTTPPPTTTLIQIEDPLIQDLADKLKKSNPIPTENNDLIDLNVTPPPLIISKSLNDLDKLESSSSLSPSQNDNSNQLIQELRNALNKKSTDKLDTENNDTPTPLLVPVVVRRERISNIRDEESSSSSLTEEQINVIAKYLDPANSISTETSSDELDSDLSMSKNNESLNNSDLMIDNSLNNNNNTNKKPLILPKPKNLTKSTNNNEIIAKVQLRNDKTSNRSNSNSSLTGSTNTKSKPIHSEYGYLCKIAIDNKNEKNSNNLERKYFTLNSDNTLSVYSNQNEYSSSSIINCLIINLSSYQIKNIDDTSFGLEKIKLNESIITNQHENNNNDEKSTKKLNIIKNLFEFNYEIKFASKDSKYELFYTSILKIQI